MFVSMAPKVPIPGFSVFFSPKCSAIFQNKGEIKISWRCTPLVHLQRGRSSCISRHHSGTRWRSSCPCSPLSKRPEETLEGSLYEPSGRELKCEKKSQLARMCVWTFKQAARFAPEEMPTSRPSSLASLLAFTMASSVVTVTVSSMTEVSRTSGINPGPTPWILCLPGAPPEEYQCLSMCRYSFRVCDSYSKYCILLSHTAQESRLPNDYFELTVVSTFV